MASLFDNILNSNDPQLQQAALQLTGQVDNSVLPESVYSPTQSTVLGGEGSGLQAIPQDAIPEQYQQQVQEQAAPQDASTGRGGVLGFIDNLANVMTDPAVTSSLMAFDASMRGDQQTQAAYNNKYAEVMGQRRAEQSAIQQQKLARQQQLEDQQSQRDWQDRNAFRTALYDQYDANSVTEYLASGDPSVLKTRELTPWQKAQVDMQQQRADTQTAAQQQRASSDKAKNLFKAAEVADKQDAAQTKKNEASTTKWEEADKALSATSGALSSVSSIASDEGFDSFFGPVAGRLPNITTDARRMESRFNQLKSQQFLEGVQAMKGMGALSDAEGAKISAAQARLFNADGTVNQTMSAKDARDAVNEIINTYNQGVKKLTAKRDSFKAPDYTQNQDYQAASQPVAQKQQSTGTIPQGWSVTKQ